MKNVILYILLIITVYGCVPKPIDIDVKTIEPKLVLSSQIIPNRIMIVSLTRSFSALDGKGIEDTDSLSTDFMDKLLVKNAVVAVSYLGRTDTLYMIQPGIYASINVLQYNFGDYSIHARDALNGQEIFATTQLIPKVQFDTIYPSILKNPGDTVVNIHFTFSDNPSSEDYYVINYIRKTTDTSNLDINQAFKIGSNSVLTQFELFDDNSFTNNVYNVKKKLDEVRARDSLAVMLSHISKGYYEFLNAYKKSGSIINQLTGEPITYPTNVINGYGYFNAYYPSIKYFDLKKY